MALAGPTAVWVASGQREARPLQRSDDIYCFGYERKTKFV